MEIEFLRKVNELGRVVLPLELRRALHIEEQQTLRVTIKDDHLELFPVVIAQK